MGLIYFFIVSALIAIGVMLYSDWYDKTHPGWGE